MGRESVEGVGQLQAWQGRPQRAAATVQQLGAGAPGARKECRTGAHLGTRAHTRACVQGGIRRRPVAYGDERVPIEPQAPDDCSP